MKKILLLIAMSVAVFSVFLFSPKTSNAAVVCTIIKYDIGFGAKNSEVKKYQQFLFDKGYFPERIPKPTPGILINTPQKTKQKDVVTGFFGALTVNASADYLSFAEASLLNILFPIHAATESQLDEIDRIYIAYDSGCSYSSAYQYFTNKDAVNKIYKKSSPQSTGSIITPTDDKTPRIAYWWGKVNQHINTSTGAWETDPGGYWGADEDRLSYCKRFYPNTMSVTEYKQETISSWREGGNIGGPYTASVQTYKCNIQEAAEVPQPKPEQPATPEVKPLPIKFTAPINNNSTVFGNKYTVKWDFDQKDLYSLTNGYQYYMLLKVKNSSFYGSLVINSVNISSKQAEIEIANNFSSGQTLYFELVRTDGQKVESPTFIYQSSTNMYENPIPDQYKTCSDGSKVLQSQSCPIQNNYTYTCWNGTVVNNAASCPAQLPQTQTCWDGSTILLASTCQKQQTSGCTEWAINGACTQDSPINNTNNGADNGSSQYTTCAKGAVVNKTDKCPIDNFNAPYNGQVMGTDGYYRWCAGGSTWNANDRSCKCPTGQAYNLSNQTCVNYSANVSLLNELKPAVLGATSYQFTRNLKKGISGDDVKQLQAFLNNLGFDVDITGYFGEMTKNSLKRYQEANSDKILKPVGLKKGTGEFHTATMKFVNDKMLGN